MAIILTELKLNLQEKKDCNFVPYQAEGLLENLQKDGKMDARVFLNKIRYFYQKCELHLESTV